MEPPLTFQVIGSFCRFWALYHTPAICEETTTGPEMAISGFGITTTLNEAVSVRKGLLAVTKYRVVTVGLTIGFEVVSAGAAKPFAGYQRKRSNPAP